MMQKKIQKIREITEDIQSNRAQFKTLYKYLDELQRQCAIKQEDSSQDQIDMQKYITPVRTMLGQYKSTISKLRANQRIISRSSTDTSNTQNISPNSSINSKNMNINMNINGTACTRRKDRNYKDVSIKELDQEIEELTKKLSLF